MLIVDTFNWKWVPRWTDYLHHTLEIKHTDAEAAIFSIYLFVFYTLLNIHSSRENVKLKVKLLNTAKLESRERIRQSEEKWSLCPPEV